MAYNDLIEEEGINAQYLAVLKPRIFQNSGWSLSSGSIYVSSFTYGYIVQIKEDDTETNQRPLLQDHYPFRVLLRYLKALSWAP